MFKGVFTYFFLILAFNAVGQFKIFNLDCRADTVIEAKFFLSIVSFEIDPFKCDPNIGIITFDQKYTQLLDIAKKTQIEPNKIYQILNGDSNIFQFHVLSNDKKQLQKFLKECTFYGISSSNHLLSGYNEQSGDIFNKFYDILVSKAIDNGLKLGQILLGKNEFEIYKINEKTLEENNNIESIYDGVYYYSSDLKFETQLNLTFKH